MGIPIGFLWGFTQGPKEIPTGSSHRIAVGILMGIPTGFLWESSWGFPQEFYGDGIEWEFHSHGKPGINAFVSIQQRPWRKNSFITVQGWGQLQLSLCK